MKLPRRTFLRLAAGAAALPAVSRIARAQTYPDRPVKIVVPVAPSGSYDIVGRALADQLSKRLGQTVVVENRPGAGTVVRTQAVIQSPADGYTVGGLSNIVFNVGLSNKPPYDPLKDLVPVALVFNISYTLIGSKALPHASPKEIVAAAKMNPGKLTFATVGVGSGQHIIGAAFMKITGTRLLDVPYRGPAWPTPTFCPDASISSSIPRHRR
jgi:tripartite-type tricarboxylate transporter receptor subunit TctC